MFSEYSLDRAQKSLQILPMKIYKISENPQNIILVTDLLMKVKLNILITTILLVHIEEQLITSAI